MSNLRWCKAIRLMEKTNKASMSLGRESSRLCICPGGLDGSITGLCRADGPSELISVVKARTVCALQPLCVETLEVHSASSAFPHLNRSNVDFPCWSP